MMVVRLKDSCSDEVVTLSRLTVGKDHCLTSSRSVALGSLASFFRLGGVAEQGFDFGGAKVTRFDGDDEFLAFGRQPIFIFSDVLTFPTHLHSQLFESSIHEVTDTVLHADGDDEVFGLILL